MLTPNLLELMDTYGIKMLRRPLYAHGAYFFLFKKPSFTKVNLRFRFELDLCDCTLIYGIFARFSSLKYVYLVVIPSNRLLVSSIYCALHTRILASLVYLFLYKLFSRLEIANGDI